MSKNEIAVIEKKEISPIESKVSKLTIIGPKDMSLATEMLSTLNKTLDKVVAYKEAKTKPLNQALKVIRGETKPIETRLEDMINSIRRKMGSYQTEQVRISQEKKDKIADRVGEGKGKFKAETAIAKMDEVDTPEAAVSTDSGTVQFRTVKNYRIVDANKIPREYLLPDPTSIKVAMKQGTEIPGVEYFEEQVPINFR